MDTTPSNIKVLIAEDDFLIAEEVSRLLKKLGYHVIGIASNGLKAIEMTGKLKPNVILMDIKMPKIDGIEAAQIITQNYAIPIVILSAHESHDLLEKASESGIGAYLTKPPKIEELDRAITVARARNQDLVESRALIKQLESHKKQLKELNANKDKFFSIIAHDLRNPVSALSAFSEQLMLNMDDISKVELQQYIAIIQNTSTGLSELLEELLLWASLQTNRYEFKPDIVSVAEVVASITSLLGTSAVNKNICIIHEIEPELKIFGDKNMVHTIFRNLISNAIKFTALDGEVSIMCTENEKDVTIMVIDTGVGIRHEQINKMFSIENQKSTPGTEGEPGSGLGLVLCREMVEKNLGKIWVESQPGIGSKFIFTLPKPLIKELHVN